MCYSRHAFLCVYACSFVLLTYALPKAFYSIFLKLENTHIIQKRRVYQNRRETHNLVNNSHPA
ncbi:hypothetical protein HanPSC8_Chr11g0476951 [Helianthus annuus]|nr:hypothetical protein HanPSC8_Chr11g0476951 [Helianthus annuus]